MLGPVAPPTEEAVTAMKLRPHHTLEIVDDHVPGIEAICTHPKEDPAQRLKGLLGGPVKLGVRTDQW